MWKGRCFVMGEVLGEEQLAKHGVANILGKLTNKVGESQIKWETRK